MKKTDLRGHLGLAWEIFNLVQGQPLDLVGTSLAISGGALDRVRLLSEDELRVVAFILVRTNELRSAVPELEIEEHWGSDDAPGMRATLKKLVDLDIVRLTDGEYRVTT